MAKAFCFMENLALEIEKWFKNNQFNRNKWNNNEVGKVLRACLEDCGNWKNKPRGNPRKGKEASDKAKRIKASW